MRVLVLSFYFRPDLCAGSFRTTALVDALRERMPEGTELDVVTTLPNRYHSFVQRAAETERQGAVEIRRISLPFHRSDMWGQSRAFLAFARSALDIAKQRKYDLVFATSSRLMTAALGARIANKSDAALYIDIRDIFVDTMKDILPTSMRWAVVPILSRIESWTMRQADRINLVSPGFEEYFRPRYGDRVFSWFTNGVDEEFLTVDAEPRPASATDRPATILYAGNIGEGQGLHEVLPEMARRLSSEARFVVIGDGGRRPALEQAAANANVTNLEIREPMPRTALLDAYRHADVLFLHLGNHAAFDKVLPSKLFEYAALGKPVLAGVGGYSARFVRQEISNAAVFAPCDAEGAVRAFRSLELRHSPRPDFVAKYRRTNIARAMADDIATLLQTSCGAKR